MYLRACVCFRVVSPPLRLRFSYRIYPYLSSALHMKLILALISVSADEPSLAGVTALVACGGCFMATSNSPQQLNSHSGSIFTLSGTVPPPASAGATLPRAAPPPSRHPRSARRSTRDEGKLASGHSLGPSYPHNPDFPQSGGPPQQHRHHQNYPENPSFLPPGYPPHPPPSYSAPSYPPSGHGHGVPSHAPATLADLPPPYTPGHMGQQRR